MRRPASLPVASGADAVREEARRLVDDAEVVIRIEGGHVVVGVSRSVTAPGMLARWGAVRLHAEATALVEAAP